MIASIRQAAMMATARGTDPARDLVPILRGKIAGHVGPSTAFEAIHG